MTKKNKLFSLLAVLFGVAMIVPMFFPFWEDMSKLGNATNSIGQFGLFADYTNAKNVAVGYEFNSTFALIVDIALVVAVVAFALYVVLKVLEIAKVGKVNYTNFEKVVALVVLAAGVVALVFGITFVFANKYTGTYINYEYYVLPLTAIYIAFVGMIGTGVCAFLSADKKAKSKSKKRK